MLETEAALSELRRRHRGPIITPEDAGYEEARSTFNALVDRRPALVARPLDVEDVVSAVAFAGQTGLPMSVRGGGHSVAGHCVGDGSLVADLRLMREVRVDPVARTAACGGGAAWEDLDPPCQRHGLATPGGTYGDTGVAGLTLGGGIGHLIGMHGLTLDNLVAATLVTADAGVVTASEKENADLFWALRGGGGNFGVVTEFEFRLHPVGPLLGGALVYPPEEAGRVLRAYRDLMAEAPDELTCMTDVYRAERTGERGALVSVAYLGDPAEGEKVIRPLRDAAPVKWDGVRLMHYAELQEIFGRLPFGLRHYWSGRFVRELPDDVIDLVVERVVGSDLWCDVLIEPLHGAASRVPAEATAFGQREARYNVSGLAIWTDPDDDQREIAWARSFAEALKPWTITGGAYLNYSTDAAFDRVQAAFGAEKYERLRSVKHRYDPENLFRFNHNIRPEDERS